MAERQVWTFFYGSFMNLDVLREVGCVPSQYEVARLPGFDIRVGPLANVVPSDEHAVYGIVATGTHSELDRLYGYARDRLGGTYRPEAVVVQTTSGSWRPALCYVAGDMEPRPPTSDYLDRILRPAQKYAFPPWYLDRLESFRPRT